MQTPPPLPRRRRAGGGAWLWFAGVLAAAVVAGFVVLSYRALRDEQPPDVSDLVTPPPELAEEENGYARLSRAALALPAADAPGAREDLQRLLEAEEWDAGAARDALAEFERGGTLEELRRALALGVGRAPWRVSPTDEAEEITPLRHLMVLLRLKARALAEEGRGDEAAAVATDLLRMGYLMEASRGGLIEYLSGVATQLGAVETLRQVAEETALSREATGAALAALRERPTAAEGLEQAMRREYFMIEAVLSEVQRGGAGALGALLDESESGQGQARRRMPLPAPILQPNQTRRLHAENIRAVIAVADGDLAAVRQAGRELARRNPKPSAFKPGNAVGKIMLSIVTPSWEKILVTRLRQQAQLSATEAVLALRAYERERGELPETLEALVPKFLPAVPRDAYDGRPIRYSKARGVVWSVGENALESPEREAWEARTERERRGETVCWLWPAEGG